MLEKTKDDINMIFHYPIYYFFILEFIIKIR